MNNMFIQLDPPSKWKKLEETYHDAALGLLVVLLLIPDHPGVDHLGAVSDHLSK